MKIINLDYRKAKSKRRKYRGIAKRINGDEKTMCLLWLSLSHSSSHMFQSQFHKKNVKLAFHKLKCI